MGSAVTTVQEFAALRCIKTLFHFTRAENLASILKHGLLSRAQCAHQNCVPTYNDAHRIDGTDAVCVSISFPNYKLFWQLRCTHPKVDWVLLKLDASALWELDCAFCAVNAASNEVTSISLQERRKLNALQVMFDDTDTKSRGELKIPNHYPTSPQAEVLLLDGAPTHYISGVVFPTQTIMDQLAPQCAVPVRLNGGYFSPRFDHSHWK